MQISTTSFHTSFQYVFPHVRTLPHFLRDWYLTCLCCKTIRAWRNFWSLLSLRFWCIMGIRYTFIKTAITDNCHYACKYLHISNVLNVLLLSTFSRTVTDYNLIKILICLNDLSAKYFVRYCEFNFFWLLTALVSTNKNETAFRCNLVQMRRMLQPLTVG